MFWTNLHRQILPFRFLDYDIFSMQFNNWLNAPSFGQTILCISHHNISVHNTHAQKYSTVSPFLYSYCVSSTTCVTKYFQTKGIETYLLIETLSWHIFCSYWVSNRRLKIDCLTRRKNAIGKPFISINGKN